VLHIAQVESPEDIADIREMLVEYTRWSFTLVDEGIKPPTFHNIEQELADLPGIYAPPNGCLLLARFEGKPAGCVALKRHTDETSELKRLYVLPEFRGKDFGRVLVEEVLLRARGMNYKRVELDSHYSMTKAHAIYRGAGFRDREAPEDFPKEVAKLAIFMELDLD